MAQPLTGQVALVTGASRGIGRACAEALAGAGASVAVGARDVNAAERVACALREDGYRAAAVCLDVTDEASIARAVDESQAQVGPIDILVNNAGIASSAPFHETPIDEVRRLLETNLVGAYAVTAALLPGMLERKRGRIINLASTAGRTGFRYTAAYCASKHGLVGLTRALALEVARKGITVNAVCPGWTETDMFAASVQKVVETTGRSADEAAQTLAKMNPIGRVLRPEEIARAVLFLADPAAGGITGQLFSVDGGEVIA